MRLRLFTFRPARSSTWPLWTRLALARVISATRSRFGLSTPSLSTGEKSLPQAVGGGEIIDTAPSGLGGRQGKLIVSARFLDSNGQRVRIRGMQLTAAGEQRDNAALAVSMAPYVGVVGIFVHGGERDLPAGANGPARIASDVDFTPAPATPSVAPDHAGQATATPTSP